MIPRLNSQSVGKWVAQFFMTNDLVTGKAYNEKTRPLLHGARYEWVLDSDGHPQLRTVADTVGPIYGLFPWPAKAPRKLAQLSFCFPAKITSVAGSTYNATPIQTGGTTGWTSVDAGTNDLGELRVYTKDGAAPAVGDFGLVVIGAEMGAQKPLFFQGGGGASSKIYRITASGGGGLYSGQEVDYPNGTDIGAPIATMAELNSSTNVPTGQFVEGTLRGDGKTWFSMPFGCPA